MVVERIVRPLFSRGNSIASFAVNNDRKPVDVDVEQAASKRPNRRKLSVRFSLPCEEGRSANEVPEREENLYMTPEEMRQCFYTVSINCVWLTV